MRHSHNRPNDSQWQLATGTYILKAILRTVEHDNSHVPGQCTAVLPKITLNTEPMARVALRLRVPLFSEGTP